MNGYGGYREVKGWGIGQIGTAGTLTLGATVVLTAYLTFVDVGLAVVVAVAAMPVLTLTVIPLGPARRTLFASTAWIVRGWWARSRNLDAYGDVLAEVPRGSELPGILEPLTPLEVENGSGGTQCVLWNRATGILSAVLLVSPVGITLADRSDVAAWVGNYGAWLADLGYSPIIDSVVFTTECSPSGGIDQRGYALSRISPQAPELAREVMNAVLAQSRTSTAHVSSRVTINFDLTKATPAPKTLSEGVTEVIRWMPRIESALASCGATVTGRASTVEIIRTLRAAFDPAVRAWTSADSRDPAADELLHWGDAGPIRTEATTEVYKHDSGFSVSWLFKAPPSGVVYSDGLLRLLSPGRYQRRVSLVYRPYPAAEAAEIVEREVQAGVLRQFWNRKTRRDVTQRELDDRARALQAAREEAHGAGLGRFTLYVTTTTRNEATLPAACADTEERFAAAKLQFRRARGAQAAAFATSLGFGLDPISGLARRAADRWLG